MKSIKDKLEIATKFILKIAAWRRMIPGDDFEYVCKECDKIGYEVIDIKHKRTCEIGKVIKQIK